MGKSLSDVCASSSCFVNDGERVFDGYLDRQGPVDFDEINKRCDGLSRRILLGESKSLTKLIIGYLRNLVY
ncbi:MAG: hypothetical protein ABIG37_00385 [Nanoarchaeota archaeon]